MPASDAATGPATGPSEGGVLATAVAAAGGLAAFEIAGLATRDGLFLSQLPASELPGVMVGSAVVSLIATLVLSQWMRASRPERIAPVALLGSAAGFTAIGLCIPAAPVLAAVLLYVQVTGIGPVVASAFWSVVNERFDPYRAKRVVARMAAAGALGGVVGGATAERLATWVGIPVLLFALAGLCCACAWATHRIGAGAKRGEAEAGDGGRGESGIALLRRIRLLRQMALLMLLAAVVETFVEYALKAEAARSFQSDHELVRFFAVFYTGCGLLAFAIQSIAGDRFLRRFGLSGAVAVLPGSVALLGAPGILVAKLWTAALARGAETVASTAFYRAGFQLLYTPMATAVKRPAKVWVDVASGSLGEILGATLVFALLFAWPDLPTQLVIAAAVAGSLAALLVVRRVHKGYVDELRDSLRRGRVEIRSEDALDRTTLQTIAQSQMSMGRSSLLERVRAYEAEQAATAASAPGASAAGTRAAASASPAAERTAVPAASAAEWPRVLSSNDRDAIRSALRGAIDATPGITPEERRQLVAWVLPRLADDDLARAARDWLRPIAPRATGQLVDLLLDDRQPLALRARIAWILGGVDDARAVDGLWRAASGPSFALRVASVRALARIAARRPELSPETGAVHAAIERELEVDEAEWLQQRARRDETLGERSVLLSRSALEGVRDSVEHVFTLLALAHDREQIASALAGLASPDDSLRGTALELLESILPAGLRRRLWPRLHARPPEQPPARSQQQLADELLKTTAGAVLDREALRKST